MKRSKIAKVVNVLLLAWFLCIPLFWQLDLSKETINYYDALSMAPCAIIHLTIFYMLAFFSFYFNKASLCLILLLSLYFPFIQLANYPHLTIRDVYLHAAPAENIIVNGNLANPDNPYAESWPGSFIFYAVFSNILGCDLIIANYILYLALIVAFSLVLYSFTKTLERKGYRLAWTSPVLFLCLFFTNLFDNFHHYSRTSLAFTFLFFSFFAFIRFEDRRGYVFQLLVVMSMLITHPFQSLALAAFLASYSLLTRRSKRVNFMLVSVIIFMGWFLFNAYTIFSTAVSFLKTFFSPIYVTPIAESLTAITTLPWWGVILRDFFKYSLVALLLVSSFATAITLKRTHRHERKATLTSSLISLLSMSLVMLLGLLFLPEWQISRFIPFAAFPAAFSSFILLDHIIVSEGRKGSSHRLGLLNRKSLVALWLLFIITLSATVMVLRFDRNYYFGQVLHSSELSSLSFYFIHDKNSTITIMSWRTYVYSLHFNYNFSHQTLRLWDTELKEIGSNQSKLILSVNSLLRQSQFAMRGMRDELDFYRLDSPKTTLTFVENSLIFPEFSIVYSNGYYSIYARAFSPLHP